MCEKKGYQNVFKIVVFSLLILCYIITIYNVEIQNDTLFDIKLGEKYLQEGIKLEDDYSIHNNLEYIAQHFGVNILTYVIFSKFGMVGLYVLGILLSSVLAFLLYQLNRRFVKRKKLAYLLVFIELSLLQPFLSVRAQMYSYLLFAIEILLIEKFLSSGKKSSLIVLSLIPFILINMHAGVISFYFILLMVYLCNLFRLKIFRINYDEERIANVKYLIIPLLVGIVMIFINPFGVNAITYGFKTLQNTFINRYITEFQPLNMQQTMAVPIFIVIGVFVLAMLFSKKKIKIQQFLLLSGTFYMTLTSIRHFSLFLISSTVCLEHIEAVLDEILEMIFSDVTKKGKKTIQWTIYFMALMVILKLASNAYLSKEHVFMTEKQYPMQAILYIEENIGKEKRIFNEYTWGSLMMLEDIKVFIDSRADLYTKEYNGTQDIAMDYIRINNCAGNYIKLLEKYQIEYLFLKKDSNLAQNILEHAEYHKIYEDSASYIIQKVN